MLAGRLQVGASVSLTVTVKLPIVSGLSGLASLAVQFTVVVPTGKVAPLAGLQTTLAPGQLSEAEAVYVTTAPHAPVSLFLIILAGKLSAGASVSLTVTVKLQVALGEHPLLAVIVTVVTPLLKVEPLPVPLPLPVVAPLNE